ncbi:MAG TPA: 1-aminocyclopropane-1-carboxylate deaminase/D-cysteine desulfhydrase, partial [Nitratifractor sp.]|nr:1-aminocyclopropane-1-carboxylate deaminase/D-cysteine desulfhydrase [Nitratifractor sp.]
MSITFNTPTPLQKCRFRGIDFLLKRDDLLHPDFSGNKARKIDFFLNNIPPEIKAIVSFGSIQSNAMYSLSAFAASYNLGFRYYANHIPKLLKEHPEGNVDLALRKGAEIMEGYEKLFVGESELLIKEGLACEEAYFGIKKLALELIDSLGNKEYQIFLPS